MGAVNHDFASRGMLATGRPGGIRNGQGSRGHRDREPARPGPDPVLYRATPTGADRAPAGPAATARRRRAARAQGTPARTGGRPGRILWSGSTEYKDGRW